MNIDKYDLIDVFVEGAAHASQFEDDAEVEQCVKDLGEWMSNKHWSNGKAMLVIVGMMFFMYTAIMEEKIRTDVSVN